MPDILQFAKDFGLPLGLLVAIALVLWKDRQRLQAKVEELYERLAGMEKTKPAESLALLAGQSVRLKKLLAEANAALEEMRAAQAETKGTEGTKA